MLCTGALAQTSKSTVTCSETGRVWQVRTYPLLHLGLLQGEVAAHLGLAGGDLGAAGAADAALAGERHVRADPLGAVQDGLGAARREGGGAAVQDQGHLGDRAFGQRVLVAADGGRLLLVVGEEQLLVDPVARHPQPLQQRLCVADHAVRAAEPPVVGVGHLQQGGDQGGEAVGVQAAGEDLGLARLPGEECARPGSGRRTGPSGRPARRRTSPCPSGGCRRAGSRGPRGGRRGPRRRWRASG